MSVALLLRSPGRVSRCSSRALFCGSSRKQGLGGQEGLETALTLPLYAASVLSIFADVNYL